MNKDKKNRYIGGAGKVTLALIDWEFMRDAIPDAKTRLKLVSFMVCVIIPGVAGCMRCMDFREAMRTMFTSGFNSVMASFPSPLYFEVLKERNERGAGKEMRIQGKPKDIVDSLLKSIKNKKGGQNGKGKNKR